MKYIKLFEDFKDSGNMSNELIQLLNEYKTDLEQNPIQPEKIQNYLDTLLTVNADIKKYDEMYEYAMSSRFNRGGRELYDVIQKLKSSFITINDSSTSRSTKDFTNDIVNILAQLLRHIERILDFHNFSNTNDMEIMVQQMREEADIVQFISSLHKDLKNLLSNPYAHIDSMTNVVARTGMLSKIVPYLEEVLKTHSSEEMSGFYILCQNSLNEMTSINTFIEGSKNTDKIYDNDVKNHIEAYQKNSQIEKEIMSKIQGAIEYISKNVKVNQEVAQNIQTQNTPSAEDVIDFEGVPI